MPRNVYNHKALRTTGQIDVAYLINTWVFGVFSFNTVNPENF